MLNAIFRPIDKWPIKPTPAANRKKSPFQSTYTATLDLLERELFNLAAESIVIQAFFSQDQLRNDGLPKGGQNPSEPGVILSFTSIGDAYSYPCDTFEWWTSNLRAIALALEALRKVDRYGVTTGREQYQGFKQIPSGSQPVRMSLEDAAIFLTEIFPYVSVAGLLEKKGIFEIALRGTQKILHPDAGGSHEQFVKLQEAAAVLSAHHNAKGKGA